MNALPSAWRTRLHAALLALSLCVTSAPALAQQMRPEPPPTFSSPAEEKRFQHLIAELRCVMCQNQSLADSNAQIAHDLRREVLVLMRQGKTDQEIKDFLVARYGEFVLYRPQLESTTWLLWFGPALVLLAGGALVATVVRRRKPPAQTQPEEDQEW